MIRAYRTDDSHNCAIRICAKHLAFIFISVLILCQSLILAKCESNELTLPPSYMCLLAVARSNKLCIDVTID